MFLHKYKTQFGNYHVGFFNIIWKNCVRGKCTYPTFRYFILLQNSYIDESGVTTNSQVSDLVRWRSKIYN